MARPPRSRYARLVAALPATVPFVPPEAFERQAGRPLKLRIGANESAFGPSPKALAAMRAAAGQVNWYCDPEGFVLREALARRHNVARDNIVLGAGIDDLLGLIVRAFCDPGDRVVMSFGAYPTFAFHVRGFGRDRNDPEALAAAALRRKARLVYLSNPDNPTGSWLTAGDLERLVAGLPAGAVLVLDEAYSDFAPADAIPALDAEDARVIRLRTFSKAYGMAGARIGYAVAPAELVRTFDKIRHHFGVNRVAQEGALAAIGDTDFIAGVVAEVESGRREYGETAARLGFAALPSATNFVALDIGTTERAKACLARLLSEENCFVRMAGVAPLNRCIRVTVGTKAERQGFAQALSRVAPGLPA